MAPRPPPERIDDLLKVGHNADDVAAMLGIQASYVQERAKLVRLDATGQSRDRTTPKYAYDDELCELVSALGGFPVIDFSSQRLVGQGGRPWRQVQRAAWWMDDLRRSLAASRRDRDAGIPIAAG